MKPNISMITSSPGRDKLPTLALPFLISGVGSWSRSRSIRSSPMVVSRSKRASRSWAENGEPSSPKVTCIGQVRMRKKKRSKGNHPCLYRKLIYRIFRALKKSKKRLAVWRRWRSLGCCRTGGYRQHREKDSKNSSWKAIETNEAAAEQVELKNEKSRSVLLEPPLPPKNALMLMRCRSAPHNRGTPRFDVTHLGLSSEVEKEDAEVEVKEKDMRRTSADIDEKEKEMTRVELSRQKVLRRSKSEPARRASAKLA